MGQRKTHARAQALRRAQEVGQARDARRRVRELEVEKVLAEYFECTAAADRLRARAEERTAAILAGAEQAAAQSRAQGTAALHRLFWLGETRASISELTGLPRAEVRGALDGVRRADPRTGAAPFPAAVSGGEAAESGSAPTGTPPPERALPDRAEHGHRPSAGDQTW